MGIMRSELTILKREFGNPDGKSAPEPLKTRFLFLKYDAFWDVFRIDPTNPPIYQPIE